MLRRPPAQTVLRGPLGFGQSRQIHRRHLLRSSEGLPVVIEIVDTEDHINSFLPVLDTMMESGLVTLEKAQVLQYGRYRMGLLARIRQQLSHPANHVMQATDPSRHCRATWLTAPPPLPSQDDGHGVGYAAGATPLAREASMPAYRSRVSTHGRNMAGARSLWRATGMTDSDFGKPIIAVANSFTQFVPGHVHLKDLGQLVAREVYQAGGIAREFNTIAVDDGIAMGHDGMLYSLPSRELIADSVEYMVNAHCADALVCISNCDKITPGMLMAALRLNIPTVFVSGGPMEAGKVQQGAITQSVDLITAMFSAADPSVSEADAAMT